MPKKITSILAFQAATLTRTTGDEIQVAGSNDVGLYRQYHAATRRRLGEPDTLTLTLWGAAPWVVDKKLKRRDRLYTVYDDASEEAWRITALDYRLGGEASELVLTCEPLWTDLASDVFFYVRETGAAAGLPRPLAFQVPLTGLTVSTALGTIFDAEYGIGAMFTLGTVEATFSGDAAFLDANGSTYLELIHQVCEQVTDSLDSAGTPKRCEFEAAYVPSGTGTGTYTFNFYTYVGLTSAERSGGIDPDSRPITEPGGTEEGNSLQIDIREEVGEYFNRLVAFGGAEDERIALTDFWMEIDSFSFDGTTYTAVLADDLVYAGGIFAGQPCYVQGAFTFSAGTITGANVPNELEFTLDASVSPPGPSWIKIQIDLDSGEIADCPYVHLVAGHEDTYGVVERVVVFEEVSAYENLFETVGGDPTFSSGATAAANGLVEIGAPTLAQNTDDFRFSSGTAALEMQADTGEGVRTAVMRIPFDDTRRYFSVWCALSLTAGRVRMQLVNAVTGQTFPPATGDFHAESSSNALLSISIDGAEIVVLGEKVFIGGGFTAYDEWWVQIIAQEDGTVCYLDALTVVQSAVHEPYRKDMGKKALYRAAADFLVSFNRTLEAEYDTEFFDADHYDVAAGLNEVVLGSWVRYRALWDGSQYLVDFTARVTEVVEEEDPVLGRYHKRARISKRNPDLADRLAAQKAQVPRLPERPLIPYEPTPVEDLNIEAQATTATYTYTAHNAGTGTLSPSFWVGGDSTGRLRTIRIADPDEFTLFNVSSGGGSAGINHGDFYLDPGGNLWYYFPNNGDPFGTPDGDVHICRASAELGIFEEVVNTELAVPGFNPDMSLAVRPSDGKIIFNTTASKIHTCDLDGSNIQEVDLAEGTKLAWHPDQDTYPDYFYAMDFSPPHLRLIDASDGSLIDLNNNYLGGFRTFVVPRLPDVMPSGANYACLAVGDDGADGFLIAFEGDDINTEVDSFTLPGRFVDAVDFDYADIEQNGTSGRILFLDLSSQTQYELDLGFTGPATTVGASGGASTGVEHMSLAPYFSLRTQKQFAAPDRIIYPGGSDGKIYSVSLSALTSPTELHDAGVALRQLAYDISYETTGWTEWVKWVQDGDPTTGIQDGNAWICRMRKDGSFLSGFDTGQAFEADYNSLAINGFDRRPLYGAEASGDVYWAEYDGSRHVVLNGNRVCSLLAWHLDKRGEYHFILRDTGGPQLTLYNSTPTNLWFASDYYAMRAPLFHDVMPSAANRQLYAAYDDGAGTTEIRAFDGVSSTVVDSFAVSGWHSNIAEPFLDIDYKSVFADGDQGLVYYVEDNGGTRTLKTIDIGLNLSATSVGTTTAKYGGLLMPKIVTPNP